MSAEPLRVLKRAKDNRMIYFCGNDVVPTDVFRVVDGVKVFPSVFWGVPGYMDDERFTVNWLIDYHRDHDVMVLIHPGDATELFPRVTERVHKIYDPCKEIVSFKDIFTPTRITSSKVRLERVRAK